MQFNTMQGKLQFIRSSMDFLLNSVPHTQRKEEMHKSPKLATVHLLSCNCELSSVSPTNDSACADTQLAQTQDRCTWQEGNHDPVPPLFEPSVCIETQPKQPIILTNRNHYLSPLIIFPVRQKD